MESKRAKDSDLGIEVSKGFIAKIAGTGLGFAGSIIFARILGPTDFGGFYLLLSLVAISQRPIIGLNTAAQKRFAEANSSRRELLGLQFLSNIFSVLLLGIILTPLRSLLIEYTGLDGSPLFFVLLFTMILFFSSFQSFLTAIGRVSIQIWIDTVRSITTLIVQLAFVLAGFGAAGMAFGLASGTIIMIPATHYYLRILPTVPSLKTVRSVWSFARYSIPSSIVGHAYDRFDILLLGFLSTQAVAGQYEIAYKLSQPAVIATGVISSALQAKVTDLDSRGKEPTRDIINSLSFGSILAIPLFFGALAISKILIVTTYGSEYSAAAALLVVLALYRVIQTQMDLLTGLINAFDLPKKEFHASSIALLINIPLGIALYNILGPVGVAVATVISESIRYGIVYYIVSRLVSTNLLRKPLIKQLIAGVSMYFIIEWIQTFFAVNSSLNLIFLIVIGATIYSTILITISSRLRETLSSIFYRLRINF
jgi:O-antigen/teichoic acid export membrane protein